MPLIDAVRERLRTKLPPTGVPPVAGYLSQATEVPLVDAVHVQRYWVLHPNGGALFGDVDLVDTTFDITWGFQITCAAGFSRDVYDLKTRVDAALLRWTPLVEGLTCGQLLPPPGFDPGPVRPDQDYKPPRFWLPLQYQTTVTR
jgi:hypothetical protein